ncbi:MAG: ABC transporter ATP-binding protein [Enterocloster asparagiformis]|nr:ABC transporter ATP-binding protein [Enterocloster asparagiformis]
MKMVPFLEAEDVCFRYFEQSKRNILDHACLEAGQGKTTVLIGPSGCGKSTLAAVCAGLYPENGGVLAGGSIRILGRPVGELKPGERAGLLSMLFQNPDLQFCMDTLRNELRFCMENISLPPEEMDGRMDALASELDLTPLLDRKLHTLSGGEKQKAALCCLFAIGSRGLFLDEPFANIDGEAARGLIGLLRERKERDGLTVMAIDHRPDLWLDLADEFVVLGEGGRVVKRGITPENMGGFEELFHRLGISFPQKLRKGPAGRPTVRAGGQAVEEETAEEETAGGRKAEARTAGKQPAIVLEGVSLRRDGSGGRRLWGTGRSGADAQQALLIESASARFNRGELTAILGPSGSGKTSLFYTLLGRRPYGGSIRVDGRELSKIRPRDLYLELGMVFQNPGSQFVTQNVLEEVALGLKLWGRPEEPRQLLEEFGLGAYEKYSPYMLSQGQQRRLAVLSMLAGGQRILLLDEPTYGQDERSTRALMERVMDQVGRRGLTVIMITHDEALAGAYAHRIYRLTGKTLVPQARPQANRGGE